jgi:predicted lipoprotein with Yx(FWY)xxD motif
MNGSRDRHTRRTSRLRASGPRAALAAAALLFGALAAVALAAGGGLTVTSASNSKLGEQIVVDAQGRTLYVLSPETTHHLLCKSSKCLALWPPLTVRSSKTALKAGSGVHGRLASFRRNNGMLQVTLNGQPLYRYAGDRSKGEANGQGIHAFGGTWHVLTAKSGGTPTATTTMPTSTTPTTPSTTPEYNYP